MKGIIYLLANAAMPGILKIGKTTKEDVKKRMKELYSTGVPLPFECVYAAKVKNIIEVESALHIAFAPNRINPKREYFEIEPIQAIAILKLLETENVSQKVENEPSIIEKVEEEASKNYAKRRPNLNFSEMNIPIGAEIIFINSGETAKIHSERSVFFRDSETSLTNATRLALGEGYAYNVAPGPYWTYNGKKLRDIYNETYQSEI